MKNRIIIMTLLLIILLIPLSVKAVDVEIKDVEILDKSTGLTEESKPIFEDLDIKFDLSFQELKDYIKYKVVLVNNDETDYEVTEDTKFSESNYIRYDISYEGNNGVIEAKEEKVVYITVTYANEVPVENFFEGKYKESNSVAILLSTKEKNPNTLVYGILGVAVPLLVISVTIILVNKRKMSKVASIVIIGLIALPLTVIALAKIEIKISSEISIEPPVKEFVISVHECKPNYLNLDDNEFNYIYKSEYKIGMTWEEFFDSDYYKEELDFYVLKPIKDDGIHLTMNGYEECVNKVTEPEFNENMTAEEWEEFEELYDAYAENLSECNDKYQRYDDYNDMIIPEEYGVYNAFGSCDAYLS